MPHALGEVHVYAVDLHCSPDDLAQAQTWLSADELGRMNSFHFSHLARRFAASHAVLRMLLERFTGVPGRSLVLQPGPYGKPFLPEAAGLHFNLSASGDLAGMCFSGDGEVGIDVEQIRPLSDLQSLAHAVLTREEITEVISLPGEAQLIGFLRYWTRKEACLKAAGVGLSVDANRLDCRHGKVRWEESSPEAFGLKNWTLHEFNPAPGYTGACVTTHESTRIHFTRVSFDSIAAELERI